MAQENQTTAEEQLKAFQTSYREQLSSRYGLDPVLANAIPFGTAQEMEDHAKAFSKSIQTASGKPNSQERTEEKQRQAGGSSGSGEASSHNTLPPVDALLAQKYKGPKGASK